ncbi:U7 snRNA-associated Sm-like protein LSm11 [Danaus plexippus]|uniref:U7 snRNA-associated Sm protein LSm11 n=1 Tax=Danaus plexippus plexippus TaxID=278856 RepID=A0A212F5D9_DANPL|nr:U7 snRNA-associated Sm-like protein LSm11 [Danaus plexippus]OWR48943.1 U7 snRNA-associated Sm protein LSm11 [Danaus plexippus plexippus]
MSEGSSSESETSACSSKYDPLKALYSEKPKLPDKKAPMYENLVQYEAALKYNDSQSSAIIPVGQTKLVQQREEEKERKKQEQQRLLEEKNKQRFAQYEVPVRKERRVKNVLTRIEGIQGPLAALRDCVDLELRIKVITRHATGVRGELYGTLVAFDKQWNLALRDVVEVWRRKAPGKRKIPPGLGTPVQKGTAAAISPVPVVTETPLGGGRWECTRHLPQMMVRGEHVVLVNVVERR